MGVWQQATAMEECRDYRISGCYVSTCIASVSAPSGADMRGCGQPELVSDCRFVNTLIWTNVQIQEGPPSLRALAFEVASAPAAE